MNNKRFYKNPNTNEIIRSNQHPGDEFEELIETPDYLGHPGKGGANQGVIKYEDKIFTTGLQFGIPWSQTRDYATEPVTDQERTEFIDEFFGDDYLI